MLPACRLASQGTPANKDTRNIVKNLDLLPAAGIFDDPVGDALPSLPVAALLAVPVKSCPI